MAKKKDPKSLIRGKRPTVASLPLCMDPDAFSDLGLATQAFTEAEERMNGLMTRKRAVADASQLDVEIAEVEAQLENVKPSDRKRLEGKLSALRVRQQVSGLARVEREMEEHQPVLDAAREELERARKAADEATVMFRARAIPQKRIRNMMREHPPTEEQVDAFEAEMRQEEAPQALIDRGLSYNPETYPPTLIAACLTEPKMTAEEVIEDIWTNENWNEQEKQALYQMVLTAINTVPLAR